MVQPFEQPAWNQDRRQLLEVAKTNQPKTRKPMNRLSVGSLVMNIFPNRCSAVPEHPLRDVALPCEKSENALLVVSMLLACLVEAALMYLSKTTPSLSDGVGGFTLSRGRRR